MIANAMQDYQITWEKLPDDYLLPDEPVDNINQLPLAAALTESLEISGKLPEMSLILMDHKIPDFFKKSGI